MLFGTEFTLISLISLSVNFHNTASRHVDQSGCRICYVHLCKNIIIYVLLNLDNNQEIIMKTTIIKHKQDYLEIIIFIWSVELWNTLPSHVKSSNSLSIFKSHLYKLSHYVLYKISHYVPGSAWSASTHCNLLEQLDHQGIIRPFSWFHYILVKKNSVNNKRFRELIRLFHVTINVNIISQNIWSGYWKLPKLTYDKLQWNCGIICHTHISRREPAN